MRKLVFISLVLLIVGHAVYNGWPSDRAIVVPLCINTFIYILPAYLLLRPWKQKAPTAPDQV